MKFLFVATSLVLLVACGDDAAPTDSGTDASLDATDAGPICEPATCADIGRCGMVADGCGGMLTCTEDCGCTSESFATDCPAMPCEEATSCTDGACVYEAITCGGEECSCNSGECNEEDLRSCGAGVCTEMVCDPQMAMVDGEATFGNACVTYEERPCGTCDLGFETCDAGADAFVCTDIPVGLADVELAQCDSTSSRSTFVFFDETYVGGDSNGSRAQPFVSLAEAVTAAQARNAEGVVIGGSPAFAEPLVVTEGVSLHGGYTNAPDFVRSAEERPTWAVDESFLELDPPQTPRLVGLRAEDIVSATVIEGIALSTGDISAASEERGADNYGAYVARSPGLRLIDITITAGGAGPGAEGEAAVAAPRNASAMNGENGFGLNPEGFAACNAGNQFLAFGPAAGGAGTMCLDGTTPSGGAGGLGATHLEGGVGASGMNGARGSGSRGGSGGQGSMYITVSPTASTDGEGPRFTTGIGIGSPGTAGGEVSSGWWLAFHDAMRGLDGLNGGGGGGGGGGSSFTPAPSEANPGCWVGGCGGGGGAGGCGGGGGGGGAPGGSSIALLVVDSSGLSVEGGVFSAGAGGEGGDGASGQAGAIGGSGGTPIAAPPGAPQPEARIGRAGGRGADGAAGHEGGSGAGGGSFGVICSGGSFASVASTFTAGTGGPGGMINGAGIPVPDGLSEDERGCE